MIKKIIAISAEFEQINNNKIFDYEVARQYPGALWPYYLKIYIGGEYQVVTADVALKLIRDGKWFIDDILVIQHVHDPIAASLIDLGCFPFLILCFESPLYVGRFYDQVEAIVSKFKYQYLPNGLMKCNPKTKKLSSQMCFPSYEKVKKFSEIKNWHDRNFMVLVASNKYTLPRWPGDFFSLRYLFWWAKYRLIELIYAERYDSSRFPLMGIELQTYRLKLVAYFLRKGTLDIYGRGWDKLRNLPPYWQKKLNNLLKLKTVSLCQDKIAQIGGYKYCLCIENVTFPGYVTEKIIDCFVAGVVPLYIGSPDIENILPKDSFIDLRNFKNFDEVDLYLNQITCEDAGRIITAGRDFLLRPDNLLYSYQGFAESIIHILKGY